MSPIKTVLSALILSAAPVVAQAACYGDHQQATMTCADGSVWDAESRTCVVTTG